MRKLFNPVVHALARMSLLASLALPLAAGLSHLSVHESRAQESGQDVSPRLQFRLPEDPYDQPLLRRSLVLDDEALHALELQVEDHERRRVRERQQQFIFFEDIERLDNSPFLK